MFLVWAELVPALGDHPHSLFTMAPFTLPPSGTFGGYCAGTFPSGDDIPSRG
ncbi:MAG TPA: hypothetical protein VII97_05480 [Anaerolineales bacterium]